MSSASDQAEKVGPGTGLDEQHTLLLLEGELRVSDAMRLPRMAVVTQFPSAPLL
ncbi:hypothetical protein ACIRO3_29760 [Streptomyces sp. NPDC102278]|uniref:hypothetical protein n=1 Tax=Streptomyces sp. NPDC102278 TaxID=3366152 RepID=UPI00381AD873